MNFLSTPRPESITAILANSTPFIGKNICVQADFMWCAGRCWIAAPGAATTFEERNRWIVLKAPGLWRREMNVLGGIPGPITNIGASIVEGTLEVSEIDYVPLMLTNLTRVVIEKGPDGQPMNISVDGLGELFPGEYDNIMSDKWLTDKGRQDLLEKLRQSSAKW